MTEFFKNSESFGMNFREFRNHIHEFCQSELRMYGLDNFLKVNQGGQKQLS